jgi:hypothetical protein
VIEALPVLATIQNSSIDDDISTNATTFMLKCIIFLQITVSWNILWQKNNFVREKENYYGGICKHTYNTH